MGVGDNFYALGPRPRVNCLPTLQAPLSRASVLIFTPMHRCLGIFPGKAEVGTDLSLGRWGQKPPKKIILNGLE